MPSALQSAHILSIIYIRIWTTLESKVEEGVVAVSHQCGGGEQEQQDRPCHIDDVHQRQCLGLRRSSFLEHFAQGLYQRRAGQDGR